MNTTKPANERANFAAVFSICWFSYAIAYFCRVNLTVAMPYLMAAYGWDKLTLGIIAGGFFWAYAIGQLINGIIGDKAMSAFKQLHCGFAFTDTAFAHH